MTGRIDVVPGDHGAAVTEPQSLDAVSVTQHFDDLGLLANLGAETSGVVEQDLVVDRPVDLERRQLAESFVRGGADELLHVARRREIEVPEFGVLPPPIGRADLQREAGALDLIPAAHLVDDPADRGELALADMVARELLLLEDEDVRLGSVLGEQRGGRGAGRTASDDRDVALDDFSGSGHADHLIAPRIRSGISG